MVLELMALINVCFPLQCKAIQNEFRIVRQKKTSENTNYIKIGAKPLNPNRQMVDSTTKHAIQSKDKKCNKIARRINNA